jgi:hypothetical protein
MAPVVVAGCVRDVASPIETKLSIVTFASSQALYRRAIRSTPTGKEQRVGDWRGECRDVVANEKHVHVSYETGGKDTPRTNDDDTNVSDPEPPTAMYEYVPRACGSLCECHCIEVIDDKLCCGCYVRADCIAF